MCKMNNYQDHMRFFHDKPIDQKYLDEGNYWQLSNNKFIYTAYAMRVGLFKELSKEQHKECNICFINKTRHSFMGSAIISRDEILGLCYLVPRHTQAFFLTRSWNFSPYPLPKLNLLTLIKEMWACVEFTRTKKTIKIDSKIFYISFSIPWISLVQKHRNYWWENNLTMVAHVACMVPFQDRAFILRTLNKKVPWYYKLIEWIDKKKKPSSRSSAAIKSFKYNQDNYQGIADYFPEDHPIKAYINNKF